MRIRRKVEAEVTLTEKELCDALGLRDGTLDEISMDWQHDYFGPDRGANVITIKSSHTVRARRRAGGARRRG